MTYYERNREERLEYQSEYNSSHRKECNEYLHIYNKQYYEKNKEKIAQRHKENLKRKREAGIVPSKRPATRKPSTRRQKPAPKTHTQIVDHTDEIILSFE